MIRIPGGDFDLQGPGHRDRRRRQPRRRCAVSVGRHPAPLPRTHDADQAFLHRQVSRHQRAVQAIPRRHALRARGPDQLPPRLEERRLSRRDGTTRPSPGFRSKMRAPMQNGRASAFPTSGSGSSPRRAPTAASIRGETIWQPANVPASRHRPHHARARSRRRASAGREPLRRDGHGWQRLAVDR